jgi:VanZ family protein
MRRPLRLLLLVGLFTAPFLVLGPPLPLNEAGALALHTVVGTFAAALVAVVVGGPRGPRVGFFVVAGIAIAAELLQALTPRRSTDPTDAIAGIFGAALGSVVVLIGRHLRARLAPHGEASKLATHPPRREP